MSGVFGSQCNLRPIRGSSMARLASMPCGSMLRMPTLAFPFEITSCPKSDDPGIVPPKLHKGRINQTPPVSMFHSTEMSTDLVEFPGYHRPTNHIGMTAVNWSNKHFHRSLLSQWLSRRQNWVYTSYRLRSISDTFISMLGNSFSPQVSRTWARLG